MSLLIKPTDEQQAIIDHPGHLVAIARPGSGKTFVLTEKIRARLARLREHQGVIAISYTNKASDEIKRRVSQAGVNFFGSFFGTNDRFYNAEIVLPFLPHLWGRPENEVSIIRIRDLPAEEQERFARVEPNRVSHEVLQEYLIEVRSYFQRGQLLLEMNGALALHTLLNSSACRNYLKARYSALFVDEYQDSGIDQHELFLELKALGLVAVAVGDVNQSIFGFSGKDSRYLTQLAANEDFTTFPINYNHRCHPSIINYSVRILDPNSQLMSSDAIHVYNLRVAGHQANIAQWIEQKLDAICQIFDVGRMSDVGILARSGRSAEAVAQALARKNRYFRAHPLENHSSIWSRLFARLLSYHFNERTTAQDIIDEFGPRAINHREVGEARRLIRSLRSPHLPEVKAFVAVADLLCSRARAEDSITLLDQSLREHNLVEWFAEPLDDEIQIMTLHKAKGLEFDLVFHLDLHEWVLPMKRPSSSGGWGAVEYPDYEQDLHLHYVGITRARKCCILCSSTLRHNSQLVEKAGSDSEFLSLPGIAELQRSIDVLV